MKSKPTKSSKPIEKRPLAAPTEASTARDKAKNVPRPARFVPSLVALAQVLGVSRQSLARWSREPGCPGRRSDGRYEVVPWALFMQNRPSVGGPDGYAQKCRRIQLQNEMLEVEIEQLQRKYVKLTDAREWGSNLASKVRSIVSGSLTRLAPEVRLCSVVEAEAKLRDAGDKILRQLNALGSA